MSKEVYYSIDNNGSILKDGHKMFQEDILKDIKQYQKQSKMLRSITYRKKDYSRYNIKIIDGEFSSVEIIRSNGNIYTSRVN